MSTTVAELEVIVGADVSDLQSELKKGESATEGFSTRAAKSIRVFGDAFGYIKDNAAAAFNATVGKAIEFESAFAEVRKTVDASDEELAQLEKTIRSMATDTDNPLSALENSALTLTQIAAAAGSLGIATQDIEEFTQTVGALTVASDLSADAAANFLARFANVTGLPTSEFDNVGNAIVELGNKMAATESEITAFANRLAPLSTFGWDADEILGYSSAMASLGLSSELGSTNLIKTVSDLNAAVADGGDDLKTFADTAGMTADEFKKLADTDPQAALNKFIEGLGKLDGTQQLQVLKDLNITSAEQQTTIMRLAGGYATLSLGLGVSTAAMAGSNAMMDEAQKKADTAAGKIEAFKNKTNELGTRIGEALLPSLTDLVDGASKAADGIQALNDGDQQGIYDLAEGIGDALDALSVDKLVALQDIDMGAGLKAFVQGIEAAGYSAQIIFDRIVRGIDRFVTDAKLRFLEFVQDFRDLVLQATGGQVDIAPEITLDTGQLRERLMDLNFGDDLKAALNASMAGGGELDFSQLVGTGDFAQSLSDTLANLQYLTPEAKQRIADSLGFEAKDAIQRGLMQAAQSGDMTALNQLIPLAELAKIDLTDMQETLRAKTTAVISNVFGTVSPEAGALVTGWFGNIFSSLQAPEVDLAGGIGGGLLGSLTASIGGLLADQAEATPLGNISVSANPIIQDGILFFQSLATNMTTAITGQVYTPVVDTQPDPTVDPGLPERVRTGIEALNYEAVVNAFITIVPHVDASAITGAVGNAVGNAAYYTGTTQAAQGGYTPVGAPPPSGIQHHSGGTYSPMDGGSEGYAWLKRGETIRTVAQERDLQRKLNGGGGGDTYQVYGSSPYDVAEMVARANRDRGY